MKKLLPLVLAVILLLALPVGAEPIQIDHDGIQFINVTFDNEIIVNNTKNVLFDGVHFLNTTFLDELSDNITIKNSIFNSSSAINSETTPLLTIKSSNSTVFASDFSPAERRASIVIGNNDTIICSGGVTNSFSDDVGGNRTAIEITTDYVMDSSCVYNLPFGINLSQDSKKLDCSNAQINQSRGFNANTGIEVSGASVQVRGCYPRTYGTGISISGSNAVIIDNNLQNNSFGITFLSTGTGGEAYNNTFVKDNLNMIGQLVDVCDESGNFNNLTDDSRMNLGGVEWDLDTACDYLIPGGFLVAANNTLIDCQEEVIQGTKQNGIGGLITATIGGLEPQVNGTVRNCRFSNFTTGLNIDTVTEFYLQNLTFDYDQNASIDIIGGELSNVVLNSENPSTLNITGGNFTVDSSTFNDSVRVSATNVTFTSNTFGITTGELSVNVTGNDNLWNLSTFYNITFLDTGTSNNCENGTYTNLVDYSGSNTCAPPNVTGVSPINPTYFHDQVATLQVNCEDQTTVAESGMTVRDPVGQIFDLAATLFTATSFRATKSPNHQGGTHTMIEAFCIDGGSGGNKVIEEFTVTFDTSGRPTVSNPSTPPDPDAPPAIGGGGGGDCPPHQIFTQAGCIPGCPQGFTYAIEQEVCLPLSEFLELELLNLTFQTFPTRVNKFFLPISWFSEDTSSYAHNLLANKRLESCTVEGGTFDCEISGRNSVVISGQFDQGNFLTQGTSDTLILEAITGEVINVPYNVQTWNPLWLLFILLAILVFILSKRERREKVKTIISRAFGGDSQ